MAAAFDQTDTTTILVYALVRPISRIDYCNGVLAGAYDVHLRQLQAVLNAAARLIVRKRKYDSISSTIRDIMHWLPIRQRVEFKTCVLVYVQLPRSFAVAGPAIRGTRCWHHSAMTNCLSLRFAVYSRMNFLPQHTTLL